jgi:hypothetical protein
MGESAAASDYAETEVVIMEVDPGDDDSTDDGSGSSNGGSTSNGDNGDDDEQIKYPG